MLIEARDDVKHADQKASVLLAALGIGYSAILGGQLSGNWDSDSLSCVGQVAWWVGVVLAGFSVIAAALAIWPRYRIDAAPKYGITYWGHVAGFEDAGALRKSLETTKADPMERVTDQLWRLSRIVLLKYRYVRAALLLAGSGAILLSAAAVVIR